MEGIPDSEFERLGIVEVRALLASGRRQSESKWGRCATEWLARKDGEAAQIEAQRRGIEADAAKQAADAAKSSAGSSRIATWLSAVSLLIAIASLVVSLVK